MPTERPIIFSPRMIRAYLEGKKRMTRRVIRPQPTGWNPQPVNEPPDYEHRGLWGWCTQGDMDFSEERRCPYGTVGSRLWFRERFRIDGHSKHMKIGVEYATGDDDDYQYMQTATHEQWEKIRDSKNEKDFAWKSPLFMPRWASRITVDVTNVRVENIQDITIPDIIDEGIEIPEPEVVNEHGAEKWIGDQLKQAWIDGWNAMHAKWKPVYRKKKVIRYECFPWSEEYIPEEKSGPDDGVPCIAYPNPVVWVVEFPYCEVNRG